MNKDIKYIEYRESKYTKKLLKRRRISRRIGANRILTIPELKKLGVWK